MKPRYRRKYFGSPDFPGLRRTREILNINPTIPQQRRDAERVKICVYDYSETDLSETSPESVEALKNFKDNGHISWINIDGIRKEDVEKVSGYFSIHPLLEEDIMSKGQRPKMDELNGILYCLLNMLYFNDNTLTVETEQISLILGKDFVLSWQEDPKKDVFNSLREKLPYSNSKIRQRKADYLFYSLLDMIVDNYFIVMEKLGEQIELAEEDVIHNSSQTSLEHISRLRKEMIVLKRNITPVRDLISSIYRSDSDLIEEQTIKYFKDILDHITQAYDLSENYRDMLMNMQDLYINNINLKMNEVMKVIAIVTCLLAPATVISGVFGMNFDTHVSFLHSPNGFFAAVACMIILPVIMLYIFRRKEWL